MKSLALKIFKNARQEPSVPTTRGVTPGADLQAGWERSFSQEGEDRILKRIFHGKKQGFYVDVGAHHPTRFSNTHLFYLDGWRGINIDATPGSMTEFNLLRPRDINLEVPISDSTNKLTYFIFNEGALNTFSEIEARKKNGLSGYKIVKEVILMPRTLESVLDERLPVGQPIDFLSVDVEGLDFSVLQSNNWNKYRPALVLVEELNRAVVPEEILKSEMSGFLKSQGYQWYAKTVNTLFFRRADCTG